MSATAGSIGPVPTSPDNVHALGSHVVQIPAAGTAQVVNPVEDYDALTVYNLSNLLVRATITFRVGITGNATAAQQTQLIPANSTMSFDLSKNVNLVAGELGAVDSVSFAPVALPLTTAEGSALTALTANAAATLVVNFAHA